MLDCATTFFSTELDGTGNMVTSPRTIMPVSMQQILPTSQRLADLDTFVRIVLPIGTVYEYRFGRNVIGDVGATYNPDQGTVSGTLTANKTEVLTYRAQASSGGGGGGS